MNKIFRVGMLLAAMFSTFGVHASNLAYWQQVTLASGGPTLGGYWIALPYSYTPVDTFGTPALDAEDLVQDFQPADLQYPCTASECAVSRVSRWDFGTGSFEHWVGGAVTGTTPFSLEPGHSYRIEVRDVGGETVHGVDLVGAHDPAFEFSDCYSSDSVNMRLISIPPHLAIDDSFGVPDVLDAEDLGQAMGGPSKVFQIRRLNETSGSFESWVVGSVFGTPFAVDLTRGYAVDLYCSDPTALCGECPWTWLPEHY